MTATIDVLATFRHDIGPLLRRDSTRPRLDDDEDEDEPPPAGKAAAPLSPRPEYDESESDSDDEAKLQLARVEAAISAFKDDSVAPTFVGRERENALAEADEDDLVIVEVVAIEVDYPRDAATAGSAIREGSAAFWVLEYEKALIRQESITAQRAIRARVRDELLRRAHAEKLAQLKEAGRAEVDAAKREVQATIDGLRRELAELRGERPLQPPPAIAATFSDIARGVAVPAPARRRTLDDDDGGGPEDRIARLEAAIAERRAATERVIGVMRREIMAFGSHLATEARALTAMQRRRKVENPIAFRGERASLDALNPQENSAEALNGLIATIESAYETLF
jgi:hypothetical protein